ncbi:MAG: shikimate dehydrogenase [Vicinamibacterales bacterium]|nr:shikimate dehydrogenase [Vicinamibacterales bacterium]
MSAPLLVVTVAAPTMAELRLRRDAVVGADLIELRIDQAADPDVSAALSGRRTPVVVTCRAAFEGGGFRGSESERLKILQAAVAQGADYVDVEFSADFALDLIRSTGGKGIVVSSHHFDDVPSDLSERVRAMRATGAEIVKVAVYPRALSDNLRLLSLGDPSRKTVLIGMGPAGLATRVLAAHFGSCWSYAGDGHAPGQIGASRMLGEFRFREVTSRTGIYGITGAPLAHSVSPAMHNAAFRAAGVDAVYMPMPAASAEDFITFANALGVKGASVTIPYKVDLFGKADTTDDLSRAVGAINTLRHDGGQWHGRNTDVAGFLAPIAGRLPLQGARVAILGSGGAARGVAVALGSHGSVVTVYGRDRSKAEEVARLGHGRGASYPVPPKSWDLLVNATPVGMVPHVDETPFDGEFDGRVVYDLIYNPQRTRLLVEAEAAGCDTIGGLDMLVAQAVEQSDWWIGRRPPVDLMRQAAQASL